MKCTDVKDLLADHLDGLLDAAGSAAVDRHLAACHECAGNARDLAEHLAVLYRIDDGPSPPEDLPDRIFAAAMPARKTGVMVLLRYAAVFLLGVGVTFAFRPEPRVIEVPVEKVVIVNAAPNVSPVPNPDVPRVPRRIR